MSEMVAKTKPKKTARPVIRSCRLDIRLTVPERKKLEARAKKAKCTITALFQDMIARMK